MIQDAEHGDCLAIALDDGAGKRLSRAEFQGLGEMPPELGLKVAKPEISAK
jgi:hypothetical protein